MLAQAAYSFYNVPNTVDLTELMRDALILAVKHEFDVFNALDIFQVTLALTSPYLRTRIAAGLCTMANVNGERGVHHMGDVTWAVAC
jgi:hypothetical protein